MHLTKTKEIGRQDTIFAAPRLDAFDFWWHFLVAT